MPDFQPNTLYYGDNLEVLRDFPSECADLVYLDPPFNSNRSYNVIFRETAGPEAEAQIEAFEDTWHWTTHTAEVFDEVASRGDDIGQAAPGLRRRARPQRHDGVLDDDGPAPHRTAPRHEVDGLDLSPLRSDSEPLF